MNSLQSFSLIVGGIFLLPILIGLVLFYFLREWIKAAGGVIVGVACLLGPVWFIYMLGRLVYLKLF